MQANKCIGLHINCLTVKLNFTSLLFSIIMKNNLYWLAEGIHPLQAVVVMPGNAIMFLQVICRNKQRPRQTEDHLPGRQEFFQDELLKHATTAR